MKLTKRQRDGLVREGQLLRRNNNATIDDVSAHLTGILLDHPKCYGTEQIAATEISDYAYGIACFVCPRSEWW